MQTLWQDLRYSFRVLLRHPGFTGAAVVTLALGIGANSAIFSVVNAVVLRPLPYHETGRLVVINETNPQLSRDQLGVSYPNYLDWRDQQSVFEQMAAWRGNGFIFRSGDEPEPVGGAMVTAGLFSTLGVEPAIGRTFLPEEDRVGAARVAVVSHGFRTRRLGADRNVEGRTIRLDDQDYTVIGVMPPDFKFPSDEVEVWTALGVEADSRLMKNRAVHVTSAVARLKPGVTIEQAQAGLDTIAGRIQQQYPGADPGHGVKLVPLHDQVVGEARPALLILFGAVGFVLAVACANVGNLLLARATTRQREMAVRAVLGASRWRVMRQLLTESTLLALLGGTLGLLLALWGVDLLVAHLPDFVPRAKEIRVDGQVLGFTLMISLLTGIIFGLAPAMQSSKAGLNEALKESGGRQAGGSGRRRLHNLLVVSEVALSLMLLVGAGLTIKSFWRLRHVNPGFNSENLLTMGVSLPDSKYQTKARVVSFFRQTTERLKALPGVEAASAVSYLPITGSDGQGDLTIEGHPFAPGTAPGATFRRNLPNYFRAMGIPLVRGREFDEHDDGQNQKVVIINETMARRYWPNEDPVGQRIKIGPPENEPWLTIVGVVGDVKNEGLSVEPVLATYEPYAQRPRLTMNLVVRAAGDAASLLPAVRSELRAVEKEILIFNAGTMKDRMATSIAPQRLNTSLLLIFATVALALAAIGIYGVISYSVTRRIHEIGIRMALGAQRGDVLKLVVGQGILPVLIGVGTGLVGAFALTRLMKGLLFNVSATDPVTFAVITLLLVGVALLACYVPARRATRVDPIEALRYE